MKALTDTQMAQSIAAARRAMSQLDFSVLILDEPDRSAVFQSAVVQITMTAVRQAVKKDPEFGRLICETIKKNIDQCLLPRK